jgi:hypothetical protein
MTTHAADDWTQVVEEPEGRKLFEALADERWDFRTVKGLSSATGLSEERVRDLLRKYHGLVRQSLVLDRQGRELYTLASRRPTFQEVLTNTRAFISKSTSTE